MSTGIESWKNLAEIGPIYPFVGTEGILVLIGVVLWVGWHLLQICHEKQYHSKAKKFFAQHREE